MTSPAARVLVVDDSPVYRKILTKVVEELPGAELVGAADGGQAAVAMARSQGCDVVVCDLQMPGMDGLETLQALKRVDPTIAVILMSGRASAKGDAAVRAVELGAIDFIPKPDGTTVAENVGALRAALLPLVTAIARARASGGGPAPRASFRAAPAAALRPAPAPRPVAGAPGRPTPARAPNRPGVIGSLGPRSTGAPAPRMTGGPAPRVTGAPSPRATGAPATRVTTGAPARFTGAPAPRVTTGAPAPLRTGAPATRVPGAPVARITGGPAPRVTGAPRPPARDAGGPRARDARPAAPPRPAPHPVPGAGRAAPGGGRPAPAARPRPNGAPPARPRPGSETRVARAGGEPQPGRRPFDLLAIGTSTGGPEALMGVIPRLPANLPMPVVIVQHMPPAFTATLAARLDHESQLDVREAVEGEILAPGMARLAPGGRHVKLTGRPERLVVRIDDGPRVNDVRPAFDVLLWSLAEIYHLRVLTVTLTGMGGDGAAGLAKMERSRTYNLTQSEATCAVFGMPARVIATGLSDETLPLLGIPVRISSLSAARRTA